MRVDLNELEEDGVHGGGIEARRWDFDLQWAEIKFLNSSNGLDKKKRSRWRLKLARDILNKTIFCSLKSSGSSKVRNLAIILKLECSSQAINRHSEYFPSNMNVNMNVGICENFKNLRNMWSLLNFNWSRYWSRTRNCKEKCCAYFNGF